VGSLDNARLQERLDEERRHLPVGHETHFHVAVSTDNENEWDLPRFISSPPYRHKTLAEQDANEHVRPRVGTFDVNVLECNRACPHSSLGSFGWEVQEEETTYRWWNTFGRRWQRRV
jgi:hypothetical protein